jgi:hypothetical protein
MRAIAFAWFGVVVGFGCAQASYVPPCEQGCVPQPCAEEYPLFWTPALTSLAADIERAVGERCESPPSDELSATLSCRAGGEDYFAIVEYDESGRLTAVQFPANNEGTCVSEYAFGYDGAHLVHASRREGVCADGVPGYEAWSDIRWNGDLPAEELVVTRSPADGSSDAVVLEGDFERFETSRRWDGEGRPLWEETLVGIGSVFLGRRDLTWSDGLLVRAVTQRNWPGYSGDQPGCDQLGPHWWSCVTTFQYQDGVMVSFTEIDRTVAVSDDCCPYTACREPGSPVIDDG